MCQCSAESETRLSALAAPPSSLTIRHRPGGLALALRRWRARASASLCRFLHARLAAPTRRMATALHVPSPHINALLRPPQHVARICLAIQLSRRRPCANVNAASRPTTTPASCLFTSSPGTRLGGMRCQMQELLRRATSMPWTRSPMLSSLPKSVHPPLPLSPVRLQPLPLITQPRLHASLSLHPAPKLSWPALWLSGFKTTSRPSLLSSRTSFAARATSSCPSSPHALPPHTRRRDARSRVPWWHGGRVSYASLPRISPSRPPS